MCDHGLRKGFNDLQGGLAADRGLALPIRWKTEDCNETDDGSSPYGTR